MNDPYAEAQVQDKERGQKVNPYIAEQRALDEELSSLRDLLAEVLEQKYYRQASLLCHDISDLYLTAHNPPISLVYAQRAHAYAVLDQIDAYQWIAENRR